MTRSPTRHEKDDDSLALLARLDRELVEIFDGWDATTPGPDVDETTRIKLAFKRGTYGKLLIEHGALRVAAKRDVARVLDTIGSAELAEEFARSMDEVRRHLDALDELARGVNAMGVAGSTDFHEITAALAVLLRPELENERTTMIPEIAAALGDHRSELHRARWVRHHAPTHPAPRARWYNRFPLLVRIESRYDHLRGRPWAEVAAMADRKVADSIDSES